MLRRIVMAICFGYLVTAFAFIALAMFNATVLDDTAFVSSERSGFLDNVALINASDARLISILCGLGLAATAGVALMVMLDRRRIAEMRSELWAHRGAAARRFRPEQRRDTDPRDIA